MRPDGPSTAPARFPGGFQAFLLVVALILAEWVVAALLHDVQGLLQLQPMQGAAMAVLLGNAMVFVVAMPLARLRYRTLFHDTSVSRRALLVLVVPPAVLLVPALLLVCGLASWVTQQLFGLSGWEAQFFGQLVRPGLATVLMVCVLAPVLEEMLFRGIVLRGFLTRYPRRVAIAASAVVFGFAHLNVHQFVVAFLIGIVLGWLYERTRSLLPSIALHAAYNSAILALTHLEPRDIADWNSVVLWIGLAFALAVPASVALRRMLRSPGAV